MRARPSPHRIPYGAHRRGPCPQPHTLPRRLPMGQVASFSLFPCRALSRVTLRTLSSSSSTATPSCGQPSRRGTHTRLWAPPSCAPPVPRGHTGRPAAAAPTLEGLPQALPPPHACIGPLHEACVHGVNQPCAPAAAPHRGQHAVDLGKRHPPILVRVRRLEALLRSGTCMARGALRVRAATDARLGPHAWGDAQRPAWAVRRGHSSV
jgi:hypothetical protein